MHRFFFEKLTLVLSLILAASCQDGPRLIPVDQDSEPSPTQDAGPECTEADLILNPNDMLNCGSCGSTCDTDRSDRCVLGVCMCGDDPACGVGFGCRLAKCIESDRFTTCTSNDVCRDRQACILDPHSADSEGFCLEVCEFDDACPAGYACIEGACSFVECTEDVCDGVDNDCDGIVDNVGPSPLAEFCVGGEEERTVESLRPPCTPGVRVCTAGVWSECTGGIDPVPEQGTFACNGQDDNCDGCIDGSWTEAGVCEVSENPVYDILFINDVSGSMSDNNDIVHLAVSKFSGRLTGPEYMWALATISEGFRGAPLLVQDLTDLSAFAVALERLRSTGSVEPSWDAVYEAGTGEMGVTWRPGSIRIIVLFTDEEGQSSRDPVISETDMCGALINGETFISVVPELHREDFDECALWVDLPDTASSGAVIFGAGSGNSCTSNLECDASAGDVRCFDGTCVSQSVIDMVDAFNRVIVDPCRP